MKKRLQGLVLGVLIGAMATGGMGFAKTGTEIIEAVYNNIKIYVDGVKIEPKDSEGKVVEPFIYNGTTYLPVRAVGEAIGKTVTWDGATQSVYLGEKPGDIQYLMDVCPAYESLDDYDEYSTSNGKSFKMGGKNYTNGFTADAITNVNGDTANAAYYNLDGKYKTISFVAGAVDGELTTDSEFLIYADDKLVKTISIEVGGLPKEYTLDLNNALRLKIEMRAGRNWANVGSIGMAEIILK